MKWLNVILNGYKISRNGSQCTSNIVPIETLQSDDRSPLARQFARSLSILARACPPRRVATVADNSHFEIRNVF